MSVVPINPNVSPPGPRRHMFFGLGAPLVLALLFAAVFVNALNATRERDDAERWHLHTLEVLLTVEALKAAANAGMRGERGYLIVRDAKLLVPYLAGRRDAPQLLARLAAQTRDNSRQQQNVGMLGTRLTHLFQTLDRAVALRRQGHDVDAVAIVERGVDRGAIDGVFASLGQVESEERNLLAQRAAANERAHQAIQNNNRLLAGVGLLLLCIAAAARMSMVRAQARVREVLEQLRRSATADELTGLANRRSFMHALEVEVARAERSRAPLSLAVVDLDHFKRINDSYGHAGGDAVLRGFAEVAAETMRTGDLVARLGGEEFAILMPGTDMAEAQRACERLRAVIANARFATPGGEQVRVTLSTGVALLVAGEERDHLVTRADDAPYRAKENGRNQVRLAA